jgi:hypothetical protein
MDFYFGTDLLKKLQGYYEPRLALAIKNGFDDADNRYHWLFAELDLRVKALRRSLELIGAMPALIANSKPDDVFSVVVHHITAWFGADMIGDGPKDEDGKTIYFTDKNPHWSDFMKASDRFTVDYDYTKTGEFLLDITEYIVTALRLFFGIREAQFRPIDRGKYDSMVSALGVLDRSA